MKHLPLFLFLAAICAHPVAQAAEKQKAQPKEIPAIRTPGYPTQHDKAIHKAGPTAPQTQSVCEAAANKAAAARATRDAFGFRHMNGYSFFPFGSASPPRPPISYRDPPSGITFYVESDGRHLAAIDPGGKLLWVRNPFVESNMCPYRSAHPYIETIEPAQHISRDQDVQAGIREELRREAKRGRKIDDPIRNGDHFISLKFNSSNFGYVSIRNGDYFDMGQN